jgi:GNAT superfamily N-acetyltransferase
MLNARESCGCEYCSPGTHRSVIVAYDLVEAAGIVSAAKKSRVTIRKTDIIFAVQGHRAVACVRNIRRRLARLCGCWVAPESRGQGIGTALVMHRIGYIQNHMSVKAIDTYAFNRPLFLRMGFEERASYKIGTTHLLRVLDR